MKSKYTYDVSLETKTLDGDWMRIQDKGLGFYSMCLVMERLKDCDSTVRNVVVTTRDNELVQVG
jgi:hypothetical protein